MKNYYFTLVFMLIVSPRVGASVPSVNRVIQLSHCKGVVKGGDDIPDGNRPDYIVGPERVVAQVHEATSSIRISGSLDQVNSAFVDLDFGKILPAFLSRFNQVEFQFGSRINYVPETKTSYYGSYGLLNPNYLFDIPLRERTVLSIQDPVRQEVSLVIDWSYLSNSCHDDCWVRMYSAYVVCQIE